jgi:type IV secretion system protein VirB9
MVLGLSLSTGAQQRPGSTAPVQAKRLPTEKRNQPGKSSSYIDQYDYGAQIIALHDQSGVSLSAAPAGAVVVNPVSSASEVPVGFHEPTDVQLTQTAREAVEMSEKWITEHNQPALGRDGRILYSYGAGLPTVVCAPLRVCMIELQAGEKLVGEPNIGDSVRWNLSPALYGKGDSVTSVIVLKPQASGLDTNLLITTDRRAYYLRLLSKPDEYVARVAFAYPDEEEKEHKWREHVAQQNERQRRASQIAELPENAVESMYFNYRVKGGDESTRPVRVFDDGRKTYIQMAPQTRNQEIPALVIIGPGGKQEMVNYRVKDDMYIVDRLFERAALILGSGRKARRVEINRERKS